MKLSYQQNANSNKTTRQPYASSTKLPINASNKNLKGMLKGGTRHCGQVIMPGNQDDHDSIQDEENLNNYLSNGKLQTTVNSTVKQ